MSNYLYLDGSCGISGDMMVAALLDLGADKKKLDKILESMNIDGFECIVSRKTSYSISGCDFDVVLHHHDDENEHHHEHRNLKDVYVIIDKGEMTENARKLAKEIFLIVAKAESKAHGCGLEDVHFHEIGAIDSIVDIVSAAVLFDDLQIKECIVTGLNEGKGFVKCQHGLLPVPVPAVLNIAEAKGIVLRPTDTEGEMVTPTGIAIVSAIMTRSSLPKEYKIIKSGIGLGKRDFGRANFLRAMIIEESRQDGQIYVLESNIDDVTGEELGMVMERLFEAKARDVHFVPCFMKKSRPSYILRVIAASADIAQIEYIIFKDTTTIGIRKYAVERAYMKRQMLKVSLPFGEIDIKKCYFEDIVRYYPEYESVKSVCEKTKRPYREIYEQAKAKAEEIFKVK